MNNYANSNSEKIRLLLNEMQKAILKTKKFQELKQTDEYLCFDFYKYHIEALISLSEKNLFDYLSFQLFNSFFDGDIEFLNCTKAKEESIRLLIDLANSKKKEDKALKEISLKVYELFGEDKMFIIDDLTMTLEELNINKKLICILLLFVVNNEFTLKSLILPIVRILRDKFPYSNFDLDDATSSEIGLKEFVEKFNDMASKIDNYVDFSWDKNDNEFTISKHSVGDIMKNIFCENDKNKPVKKRKEKRKKKEQKNGNLESEKKNCNTLKDANEIPSPKINPSLEGKEQLICKAKVINENEDNDEKIIEKNNSLITINNSDQENIKSKNIGINNEYQDSSYDEKNKYEELLANVKKNYENKLNQKDKIILNYKKECDKLNEKLCAVQNALLEKTKMVKQYEFNFKINLIN